MQNTIHQIPGAGTRLIKYVGDLLEIRLETDSNLGHAFVRTTFASLHARRQEVIKEVEQGIPPRHIHLAHHPRLGGGDRRGHNLGL